LTTDEAGTLEGDDHLVNGRGTNPEVALHIGFGGWTLEYVRIDIDEGQILALLFGESLPAGAAGQA
jgi:hypothetical protein